MTRRPQDVVLVLKPDGWRAAFKGSLSRPRPSITEAVKALLEDLEKKDAQWPSSPSNMPTPTPPKK